MLNIMKCLIIFSLVASPCYAYDPADYEYLEVNPYTGNPDATWKESAIETVGDGLYLRLDTINDPLTASLTIGDGSLGEIAIDFDTTTSDGQFKWRGSDSFMTLTGGHLEVLSGNIYLGGTSLVFGGAGTGEYMGKETDLDAGSLVWYTSNTQRMRIGNDGHISMGANVDPTAIDWVYFSKTGDMGTSESGFKSLMRSNGAGSNEFNGMTFEAEVYGSGIDKPVGISGISSMNSDGSVSSIVGTRAISRISNTGTLASMVGYESTLDFRSSGNVTNAYGYMLDWYESSYSGTVTNLYGLHLGTKDTDITVTNYYPIYQQDTTGVNYFGSFIGIDPTPFVPTYRLDTSDIGNSQGDLKLQGDVQGEIYCFGDTKVLDDADGKKHSVQRIADEDNHYIDTLVLANEAGAIVTDSNMELRSDRSLSLRDQGTLMSILGYDDAVDQFVWGLDDDAGNQFIICNQQWWYRDYDIAPTTDPTFAIFSDTDPNSNNTQNMLLWHNKTNANISVGLGNLMVDTMVQVASIWHAYGGFEDQAETITCGSGDWNHITNGANNLWNCDEADGVSCSGDVFTITNGGDYWGTLSLDLSALNGKDFHIRVYNNTQTAVEGRPMGISTTGAGNKMNVTLPLYIEATAGDALQFEISSADGTDPVVDDAIFVLVYLHD